MDKQTDRWAAVLERDRARDGEFVYGVRTTGIYCRPSCPSRRPLRRNVRFFDSAADAERDGLRPCLRCRPKLAASGDPQRDRIESLCRYIEAHYADAPSLSVLAEIAQLSPDHLQRRFKAVVGLTPKQFTDAVRRAAFRRGLRQEPTVADAVYAAGFGSGSRAYEGSTQHLGMSPGAYRAHGKGQRIEFAALPTPLGVLLIAATEKGVCAIRLGDDAATLEGELRAEYSQAVVERAGGGTDERLRAWADALMEHLQRDGPSPELPTDIRATAFQARVWHHLRTIPRGEVRSYGEIARAIGAPAGARAVAGACASNPLALLVPCHRVVRGDGKAGGYRWGAARKRRILAAEKAAAANLPHEE